MTPIYWQGDEWEKVKALLATGLTVHQVAKQVERTPRSIWSKLLYERQTPEDLERRRTAWNETRRLKERKKRAIDFPARYQPERVYTAHEKCPEHVLAERAKVMAAERSPIDELLGTPPAGRSALDRKMGVGA